TRDVDEPRRGVTTNLSDRAVRPDRLRIVLTPLIRDRRVEPERPDAQPRVEAHGVALFVHRRVAPGEPLPRVVGTERQPAGRQEADGADVPYEAPGIVVRHAVRMEPREHRLEVQLLERGDLRAHDDREVLAAIRSGTRQRAVPTGQLILDVDPREVILDIGGERRVEVYTREVPVGVVDLVVRDRAERL